MKDYYWGEEEEKKQPPPLPTTIHQSLIENGELGPGSENNVVEVANNRIYFYSGVNRPKILKLNRGIHNLNVSMLTRSVIGFEPPPIKLHISSYGGSVFAGLAAVDYIKNSKVPVETIIDGCAASAATLMSIVGEHRCMHRHSCMLVHQLSGMMWGKFEEMKDDMMNSEMLMKKIKNLYKEHTRIPKKELDNILKHDIWWEAEKCLEYGLVDEII